MTVVAGIKAVCDGAELMEKVAKGLKRIDSSEALQSRFDESAAEVHREVGQVSHAVSRALVAHALGRHPSDEDVTAFMTAAVNDPAFPHRAFRLLGEMRKAASHRRRAFLASVLFGLPFKKLPDDDRDRIDMVVERAVPADIELLDLIAEKERRAKAPSEKDEGYMFQWTSVAVFIRSRDVRLVTTDDSDGIDFKEEAFTDPRYCVDQGAFAALRSLGCIDIGERKANQGEWSIHSLIVTSIGRMVSDAVNELRPGFSGVQKEPEGNRPKG